MSSVIEYLIIVPGREFCSLLAEPLPENVVAALDRNRCISFEGDVQGSDMWVGFNISPVAVRISTHLKWTSLFTSYHDAEGIRWQKEQIAEVLEFESHLRLLLPGKKILRVDECLISTWGALISHAENLNEIEEVDDPPDFHGWTYYGWLCELRYVEPFFEWLKENYPPDYPEQPADYKGWVELQ